MRLIAAFLLSALCVGGLAALEFSGADLQAIAAKSKTMKEGESASIKVMVDGKEIFVGLVAGANGVTVAGAGFSSTFRFLETPDGLAVQVAKPGQTPEFKVVIKDGRVAPAPATVAAAFTGAAAPVTTTQQVQADAQAAEKAQAPGSPQPSVADLNSALAAITAVFVAANNAGSNASTIPSIITAIVDQTDSNTTQQIVNENASGDPNS